MKYRIMDILVVSLSILTVITVPAYADNIPDSFQFKTCFDQYPDLEEKVLSGTSSVTNGGPADITSAEADCLVSQWNDPFAPDVEGCLRDFAPLGGAVCEAVLLRGVITRKRKIWWWSLHRPDILNKTRHAAICECESV